MNGKKLSDCVHTVESIAKIVTIARISTNHQKCKQRSATSAPMRLNRSSVAIQCRVYSFFFVFRIFCLTISKRSLTYSLSHSLNSMRASQNHESHQRAPSVELSLLWTTQSFVWTACDHLISMDLWFAFIRKQLCLSVCVHVWDCSMFTHSKSLWRLLIANYLMIVFLVPWLNKETQYTQLSTVQNSENKKRYTAKRIYSFLMIFVSTNNRLRWLMNVILLYSIGQMKVCLCLPLWWVNRPEILQSNQRCWKRTTLSVFYILL